MTPPCPPSGATRQRATGNWQLATLLLLALLTAACGRRPQPLPPRTPLRSATLSQLVSSFNANARAIQTMSLKLTLSAKARKHKYPKISAYLLIRQPADIRLWGTFTLLGKIFDMASKNGHFELSIPTVNRFYVGLNNVIPKKTSNPWQSLRPQVIVNAMLTHAIAPGTDVALDPGAPPDTYQVLVLVTQTDHHQRLERRITFSRYDLLPHSQDIYDGDGIHFTRATYNDYTVRDNLPVPTRIVIERPVEGYTLDLQLKSNGIVLNRPFNAPNTFKLTPAPGATVIDIGDPSGKSKHAPAA